MIQDYGNITCPRCGSPTVFHAGKNGKSDFLGCSQYGKTHCHGTVNLPLSDKTTGITKTPETTRKTSATTPAVTAWTTSEESLSSPPSAQSTFKTPPPQIRPFVWDKSKMPKAGASCRREYEHQMKLNPVERKKKDSFWTSLLKGLFRIQAEHEKDPGEDCLLGALGEEETGRLLEKVEEKDFYAIHDRKIPTPGGHENVDHLVIGPTGVFVVETKNWSGWVHLSRYNNLSVKYSGHRKRWQRRKVIKQVQRQTAAIQKLINEIVADLIDPSPADLARQQFIQSDSIPSSAESISLAEVVVEPIVCIHKAEFDRDREGGEYHTYEIGEILVIRPEILVKTLNKKADPISDRLANSILRKIKVIPKEKKLGLAQIQFLAGELNARLEAASWREEEVEKEEPE